ncbi:MAG: exodeoxyribonuclease VII large subunit [Nitrospiraceae bacterium]|nr:MAG: exodeoxyribonuclease VII large subunit [Nitrospiraceae bacterium]
MPEILSLFELNQLINSVIDTAFPRTFLVTAEIASCDVKNHCYLALIDKDNDTVRAEMKAVIWAGRFNVISTMFRNATGIEFSKGIKILFEASVDFHVRYGLKLNIVNIDPSYTIGEMAVRRKEILERLTKEGIKARNRELQFPPVPQRIGIISSATAAGYEDLMAHLTGNSYGYKFTTKLYDALMQGDRAEPSIVAALNECMRDASHLDVVVIVRGGGGQADLHCFDSYEIARAITSLQIPVISGIGHERDVTVVDEVSNIRAKTPTAVAGLIITRIKDFEDRVDSLTYSLVQGVSRLTSDEREKISFQLKTLESRAGKNLLDNSHSLSFFIKGLRYSLKLIESQRQMLQAKESNVNHLDPVNVLKRGYSITYHNGKALKSASDAEVGDCLQTVLHKGRLISTVKKTLQNRRKDNE